MPLTIVKRNPVKKPIKRKVAVKRKSAPKAKHYYSLVSYEHGKWIPEFGDYDKETVQSEYDDYRDRGYKVSQLKIIRTGDKSHDIFEAIKFLNK